MLCIHYEDLMKILLTINFEKIWHNIFYLIKKVINLKKQTLL